MKIPPGPLSPKTAAMLTDLLERLEDQVPSGKPPLPDQDFAGGWHTSDFVHQTNVSFRVMLLDGPDENGWFSWQECIPDSASDSGWSVLEGGRYGTPDQNPLFEANGLTAEIGQVVLAKMAYQDAQLDWVYSFDAPTTQVFVGQLFSNREFNPLYVCSLVRYFSDTINGGVGIGYVNDDPSDIPSPVDVVDPNLALVGVPVLVCVPLISQNAISPNGLPLYAVANYPPPVVGTQISSGADVNGLWQFQLLDYSQTTFVSTTDFTSSAPTATITVDVIDTNGMLTSSTSGSSASLIAVMRPSVNDRPLYCTALTAAGGGSATITVGQTTDSAAVPTAPHATFTGTANTILADGKTGIYGILTGSSFELRGIEADLESGPVQQVGMVTSSPQIWQNEKTIYGAYSDFNSGKNIFIFNPGLTITPPSQSVAGLTTPFPLTLSGVANFAKFQLVAGTGLGTGLNYAKLQLIEGVIGVPKLELIQVDDLPTYFGFGTSSGGVGSLITTTGSHVLSFQTISGKGVVDISDIFGADGYYSCRGQPGVDAGPIVIKDVGGVTYTLTVVGGIVIKLG